MLEVRAKFAWRKESVQTLKVGQVEFSSNTIRLDAGQTKNDEPAVAVMPQVMRELLTACCAGKSSSDFVLTYPDGIPVKDYRKGWTRATKAAGLPDLIVHDLCRTGIRSMRRRRLDNDVVMKIAVRKTDSIFYRCHIVYEHDLIEAAQKIDEKQICESFAIASVKAETGNEYFKAEVTLNQ